MTVTISISCDDCGSTEETSSSLDAGVNEIETALDDGWMHNADGDYCPVCAPDHSDN